MRGAREYLPLPPVQHARYFHTHTRVECALYIYISWKSHRAKYLSEIYVCRALVLIARIVVALVSVERCQE